MLWLLALLVRVWNRTLRFDIDAETDRWLVETPSPVAVALWHNRLFVSAELFRRYRLTRRICALVSSSKDGAWLAAFYRLVGIYPVRGSSSNFGREAAQQLIDAMRAGRDAGITPDGPRGPIYTVEAGLLVITRRTNAPIFVLGVEFSRAWRLNSWDRFYVPFPFSRIKVRSRILHPRNSDGSKVTADELRTALLELNPDSPAG